ncbi:unnamed protein product [Staurois parvus]|uniref:Uncharacterized protein n=1 Tax=Staurois parvus TaxID=386267 RepID=A0ABN9CR58_9NEOB|nr:unnamed protein product [Staurois parvus]
MKATFLETLKCQDKGRTDNLETLALPEGPGCPWYHFHRLF